MHVERPVADWVDPAPPHGGLPLYVDVVRSRVWLIVVVVALSVVSAGIFVSTTDRVYRAEADLLVTPIPRTHASLFGFGLVSESGDPTRDVETLAQLIATPGVAERVRRRLGLNTSARSLLAQVSAEPVAQSDIVTITAEASDARGAALMANAFAEAAIAERTARFHEVLDSVIPRLRSQLAAMPPTQADARETASARLQDLETYRVLDDPTLHFETRAVPPAAATAPRPVVSIAAAFISALVLGVGAVLGAHLIDRRIIREEDLRRYRIPILARVPIEAPLSHIRRRSPLLPNELRAPTTDAFSRLSSSLAARTDGQRPQTLFVTAAAPSDGKTTTSLNLAASLATLNQRVVLIEADARRPSLSRALGIVQEHGVSSVVAGRVPLAEALEQPDGFSPGLRVLPQEPTDSVSPVQVSNEAARALVREAERLANWVILDGPALNYAPDALPLAKHAAGVIIVVRLKKTREGELEELAELLTQQGITPDGFIVLGARPHLAPY